MKTTDEPLTTFKPYYIIHNKSESITEITKATTVNFEETIQKLYDLMDQQSYYGDVDFY